jgi:UDP-N-acetylmuramyl pentapeptide phosphotransferase/UDP-N-acetylglucosamine-1-phosphate transferase
MPHTQPALWAAIIVAGCAGLSALSVFVLRPLLVRYLLAHPNARSSHMLATPQGAGLAVIVSVLAGCGLGLLAWTHGGEPSLIPVLAAALALTLVGALDDAHALPVSWRLVGQALAALVMVACLPSELRLLPGLLPLSVERALMVVGTIWFVNAVNFLDGLDWMTVAQVVPMTLGIAILHFLGAVPDTVGLLALALLGAMLGFAIFNKYPAQVFLGDAGSLPIGLLLAFMLIVVAGIDLAAALLLSLYTLSDTTLTLFRRMAAKQPIFSAHRTHFYQRAVAQGFSVPQVTARVFLLELALAILAVGAAHARSTAIDLVALGLGAFATGITLWRLARGPK